jgi:hypothetical protein
MKVSPIPNPQSPIPNRQSPITNPQSPIPNRYSPINRAKVASRPQTNKSDSLLV